MTIATNCEFREPGVVTFHGGFDDSATNVAIAVARKMIRGTAPQEIAQAIPK